MFYRHVGSTCISCRPHGRCHPSHRNRKKSRRLSFVPSLIMNYGPSSRRNACQFCQFFQNRILLRSTYYRCAPIVHTTRPTPWSQLLQGAPPPINKNTLSITNLIRPSTNLAAFWERNLNFLSSSRVRVLTRVQRYALQTAVTPNTIDAITGCGRYVELSSLVIAKSWLGFFSLSPFAKSIQSKPFANKMPWTDVKLNSGI